MTHSEIQNTSREEAIQECLRLGERARALGEDWHEGVPPGEILVWASNAAGVLLALESAIRALAAQPAPDIAADYRAMKAAQPAVVVPAEPTNTQPQ